MLTGNPIRNTITKWVSFYIASICLAREPDLSMACQMQRQGGPSRVQGLGFIGFRQGFLQGKDYLVWIRRLGLGFLAQGCGFSV